MSGQSMEHAQRREALVENVEFLANCKTPVRDILRRLDVPRLALLMALRRENRIDLATYIDNGR